MSVTKGLLCSSGRNLNFILEDYFDYFTLNHKSITPSPNPSPKPSLKHTSSLVQQSKPMVESHNPTPIIQILKKVMNSSDSEYPVGECTDVQKQLTYFSASK